MWRADSFEKTLMLGKTEGGRRRGHSGWHHRLNGHKFELTPEVGHGQGGLACYSPWGHKESEMTEQLNCLGFLWLQWSGVGCVLLSIMVHKLLFSGFSCCRWALGCTGFSSCSTQAQYLWYMGLFAPWHVESSLDQDLNPCPLHRQADFHPWHHQGSVVISLLNFLQTTVHTIARAMVLKN